MASGWWRRRATPLENRAGGADRWYLWRRHRIAYGVRGNGSPLLLVHGIHAAAWSYEWRLAADALGARHTVYTIDLLGFGRSDRPAIRYSSALYVDLLSDVLRDVVRAPCTMIAGALGAAYATAAAARHPERVGALVLVEPAGLTPGTRRGGRWRTILRRALYGPVVGASLFHAQTRRSALRRRFRLAYATEARVTDDMVEHYHETARQPGARHAPAAWGAFRLDLDVTAVWPRLIHPTLIVWGAHPHHAPLADLRALRAARPAADAAIIEGAGDLPHEESSEDFVEVVEAFLSGARQDSPVVL